MLKYYWLFCLMLMPLPLWGADAAPYFLRDYIKATQPVGAATLRKFFIKVYDAQLWMDGEKWSYARPFALRLT